MKQRKFYCDDEELKQLQQKAREHFKGHGFFSKFMRKLAGARCVLIIEGEGEIKISLK